MKLWIWIVILVALYVAGQFAYTFYHYRLGVQLSKNSFAGTYELGDKNSPDLKLFVHGDSVAAGVGATSFEQHVIGRVATELAKNNHVILSHNAVSGNRVADIVGQQPREQQDLIILIVSSNDLFKFTSLPQFQSDVKQALSDYSKQTKRLVIVGPGRVDTTTALPFWMQWYYKWKGPQYSNIISEESKAHENVVHISPFFPPPLNEYGPDEAKDRFHPNDEGHRYWFDMVMAGVTK